MLWRVCGTSRGVGRPGAQQGLGPLHVESWKRKSGAAGPSAGLAVCRLSAAGQGLGAGDQGVCGQPAALAAPLQHAGHDLPSTVYALRLGPLPRLDWTCTTSGFSLPCALRSGSSIGGCSAACWRGSCRHLAPAELLNKPSCCPSPLWNGGLWLCAKLCVVAGLSPLPAPLWAHCPSCLPGSVTYNTGAQGHAQLQAAAPAADAAAKTCRSHASALLSCAPRLARRRTR